MTIALLIVICIFLFLILCVGSGIEHATAHTASTNKALLQEVCQLREALARYVDWAEKYEQAPDEEAQRIEAGA